MATAEGMWHEHTSFLPPPCLSHATITIPLRVSEVSADLKL